MMTDDGDYEGLVAVPVAVRTSVRHVLDVAADMGYHIEY